MLWLLLEESGELLEVVEAVEEINVELYRLAIVERYGQNAVLFVVGELETSEMAKVSFSTLPFRIVG